MVLSTSLIALAFYFVAATHPDYGGSLPYGEQYDGWVDSGPYFTWEDCKEAIRKYNWNEIGVSECYAKTITLKGENTWQQ